MAKAKRISQGSVENCVVRNCVCLSFLFIDNSIHIHCSSSSRPRYRSSWFQQNQKAVNWTNRSPLERAQYRQGSMGSTSYQCSTRGHCSTNWNSCLIDAGKPTGSTFQWCPSLLWFLRYLLPFSNLAHHQPRVVSAHLSRTQGDSEGIMTRSMSQEDWKGLSACNSYLYRLNNIPSVRVAHCSLSSNTQW